MPTKTFHGLPKDKQNRILKVATTEFSQLRFDEVSINEIIKKANISRGSFYQYFTDKDDLFMFLARRKQLQLVKSWKKKLQEVDGDIFAAFSNYAEDLIDYEVSEPERIFDSNMFIFLEDVHAQMWAKSVDGDAVVKDHPKKHDFKDLLGFELISRDNLRVDDDEDLLFLLRIMTGMLIQIFQRKMHEQNDFSKEKFKRRVDVLVDWLKNGTLKEQVDD